MSDNYRGYRGAALSTLQEYGAQVWSDVEIHTGKGSFTGIVLPRSETADPLHIVLKLRSGYNVGIEASNVAEDHRPRDARKHTTRSRKRNSRTIRRSRA